MLKTITGLLVAAAIGFTALPVQSASAMDMMMHHKRHHHHMMMMKHHRHHMMSH